ERPESVKTGREIAEVAGEDPGWSSKTGPIPKRKPRARKPEPEPEEETEVPTPDPGAIKGTEKEHLPDFIASMLATLAPSALTGKRWLLEIKFDGYRLQARIEAGRVQLLSRGGLDWTDRFGKQVIAALRD